MPHIATVAFTAFHFYRYVNRTILDGTTSNGSVFPEGSEPDIGNLTVKDLALGLSAEECTISCQEDAACDCVVFDRQDGRCSKRMGCRPELFVTNGACDVYVRIRGDAPDVATVVTAGGELVPNASVAAERAAAAAAAERRAPPEEEQEAVDSSASVLNVSMMLTNVDCAKLGEHPTAEYLLRGAVQAAIAKAAGQHVSQEDVQVQLSLSGRLPAELFPEGESLRTLTAPPDALVLMAAVRVPGGTPALEVAQGLRSVTLRETLAREVSDLVGRGKASVGPVSVARVRVFEPEQGSEGLFWRFLRRLTLRASSAPQLACVGLAACLLLPSVLLGLRQQRRFCSEKELALLPSDEEAGRRERGLRLDFVAQDGLRKAVWCSYRPLGLAFDRVVPTLVSGLPVGSYAKSKGVEVGWRLTHIGGRVLPTRCTLEQVQRWLEKYSQDLEPWALRLDFDTGSGGTRTLYFVEGPLGMEFVNRLPVVVDRFKPGSLAQERGVEEGWTLTRIGDVDLRAEKDFETVLRYILDGLGHLPNRARETNNNEPNCMLLVPNPATPANMRLQEPLQPQQPPRCAAAQTSKAQAASMRPPAASNAGGERQRLITAEAPWQRLPMALEPPPRQRQPLRAAAP